MGADITEFSVQGKSGTCRQFSDLFNREIISYSFEPPRESWRLNFLRKR